MTRKTLPPLLPGAHLEGRNIEPYGTSQSETLADVQVVARNGSLTLKFHSYLLSVHSDYFTAALKYQEKSHGPTRKTIRLDVEPSELEMMREFIYTGEIKNMNFDKAQDMVRISDMYKMPVLMGYAQPYLWKEIANENCLEMHAFASTYHCLPLATKAYNYALRNIWEIVNADDKTEFCQLELSRLTGLLQHDRLNTPTESGVFRVIWTWIQASPAKRLPFVASLIESIRFGLIRPEEWPGLLAEANHSEDARKIIHERKSRLLLNPLPLDLRQPISRPRIPPDVLFCIGGWSSGTPTARMEVYDPKVNRWFECGSMDNQPRAYHGVAVINGYIYVVAGYDAVEYFASVRRFDPRTRAWSEASPMYTKRCYVNVAAHNGLMYAVGGFDGHQRFNTAERYDPATNQWSFIAPMHNIRSDTSCAFLNGKLYVAGGFDGREVTATVERYDPEANEWSAVRDMNTPRSGVSLIAHRGHLYVLGGFDGHNRLSSVEKYTPETNSWKTVEPMHSQRSNFSVATMHDYIYVAGGYNGTTTVNDAERYDVEKGKWEVIQPMIHDRSALKICVVEDLENSAEFTYHGRHHQQPAATVAPSPKMGRQRVLRAARGRVI